MTTLTRPGPVRETHDLDLDGIIDELRQIARADGLGRKVAIGELVLRHFFGGSITTWRSKRYKNHSLRRIASRVDCPFGKSTLHEAVGIYVAVREMPELQTFGHVSASHVAAVLAMPEHSQAHLLRCAEEMRWSVRRLKQEVGRCRSECAENLQTPPKAASPLNASLAMLRSAVALLLARPQEYPAMVDLLRHAQDELAVMSRSVTRAVQRAAQRSESPLLD